MEKTTVAKRKPRVSKQAATDIREQFAEEAAAALRMLLELMANSDTDAVRLKAAQDILDRAGFKSTERREVAGVNGVVNTSIDYSDPAKVAARIEELRNRLLKGKSISPMDNTSQAGGPALGSSQPATISYGEKDVDIKH